MDRKILTIGNDGKLYLGKTPITSFEQLVELAPKGFFASSSVDFPEEYTTDPTVLGIIAMLGGPTIH